MLRGRRRLERMPMDHGAPFDKFLNDRFDMSVLIHWNLPQIDLISRSESGVVQQRLQ